MALLAPEQMAHLARTLIELAQAIIGQQRDSGVGAELEQSWRRDGMRLTIQHVQKSASAMLPPMPTTSAGGDASQPAAGENPRTSRWRRRTLRGTNEIPQHAGAELKEEQKGDVQFKKASYCRRNGGHLGGHAALV